MTFRFLTDAPSSPYLPRLSRIGARSMRARLDEQPTAAKEDAAERGSTFVRVEPLATADLCARSRLQSFFKAFRTRDRRDEEPSVRRERLLALLKACMVLGLASALVVCALAFHLGATTTAPAREIHGYLRARGVASSLLARLRS